MSRDRHILASVLKQHWSLVVVTCGLSLASALSEVFSIGMLIPFLQAFTDDGGTAFRTGIAWIDDHVLAVSGSRMTRMYRICGIILGASLLRSALEYGAEVYATVSRARIVEYLRNRIVDQLLRVSPQFFLKRRSGDLLNSITNEIGRTSAAVSVVFNVATQATLVLAYLAFMVWISWRLSAVAILVFGLLGLGLTYIMRRVQEGGQYISQSNSTFTSRITEFIQGIRTIVAYNRQPFERERLQQSIRDIADATIHTHKRKALVRPVSQATVSAVLIVLIVFALEVYVLPGALSIAFLLTFLFALFRMMPSVHNLNSQRSVWAENRAGLARVAELIDDVGKPYLPDGSREATAPTDAIVFENVWFAYETGEPVLRDVNVRIEAGHTTALVGGSGAGKTTLADLIPRMFDPTTGRILWDGIDLCDFDVRSLRDHIATVSQHTYVFNDTARSNIAYGRLEATDDEIREAASMANAHSFIKALDNGYDTVLGDRGVRLSGGQRQRIAIARALLNDPDVLILDEATSHLDSISEHLVQESMERLMQNRTVVAIAHRLSTIENADWVIVLEDGEVVEQGTYDYLLERRGWLWRYHRMQFQEA